MPLPLAPIIALGAAALLIGRKKPTAASSGTIRVIEGQGGPDTIELERDELLAVRLWGSADQVWNFDTALPRFGPLKRIEKAFDRAPKGGQIPTYFTFRARQPGSVSLAFSRHEGEAQDVGETVVIETRVS